MKTAIATAAFLTALTVPMLTAADHVCVKDGMQTAAISKSTCEKGGGRWQATAKPKKSQPTKKKGSK
jgi:hypothetical protein